MRLPEQSLYNIELKRFSKMQPQNLSSCGLPSPLAARLDFFVLNFKLMPPRFHCTGGCWGWIKTFRENHIDCQGCQLFGYLQRLERGCCPFRLLKLRQMETQGLHTKFVLPWLVFWAHNEGTKEFCPALTALVGPVQNTVYVSSPYTISLHLSRSPSKLDRQSWRVTYLLISVSGIYLILFCSYVHLLCCSTTCNE